MSISRTDFAAYQATKDILDAKAKEVAEILGRHKLGHDITRLKGAGYWKFQEYIIEDGKFYLELGYDDGCRGQHDWESFHYHWTQDAFLDKTPQELADVVLNEIKQKIAEAAAKVEEQNRIAKEQNEKAERANYERLKEKFEAKS